MVVKKMVGTVCLHQKEPFSAAAHVLSILGLKLALGT